MTWPTDDQGQQAQEPPRPYQGSYPDSPFDRPHAPPPHGRPAGHEPATGLGRPAGHEPATGLGRPTGYEPVAGYEPAAGYGPGYEPVAGYGPGYEQPLQYGVPTRYGNQAPGTTGYGQGHGAGPAGAVGQGQQWAQAPPPPAGRAGLLVGLAIAGLVLVVDAVAGILYVREDGDPVADPGPTSSVPTATSALPTSPGPPAASSVPGRPDPTVAGWQVAISGKRRLAYDVPPDWRVLDEERIVGFGDAAGEPQVGMSGASVYRDGYCAEAAASWRAAAGFSGYRDTDLALVATDAATKWSNYGYLGPNGEEPEVTVAAASELTVNGITGAYTRAAVRITAPAPCAPPTAVVHTFALPADEGGSYVFVVVADQEVPDAFTDDTIRQIVSTVRPMA